MKQLLLCIQFITYGLATLAQNEVSAVIKQDNSFFNKQWGLSENVWSHSRFQTGKGNKEVINFDIIENWKFLGDHLTISPDGNFVAYDLNQDDGNAQRLGSKGMNLQGIKTEVIVRSVKSEWQIRLIPFDQDDIGFFSSDSRQYIFRDSSGLCFLMLEKGVCRYMSNVQSYKTSVNISAKNGSNASCKWIAVQQKDKGVVLENLSSGKQVSFASAEKYEFDKSGDYFLCTLAGKNGELVIYDLNGAKETHLPNPLSYLFSSESNCILLHYSTELKSIDLTNGNNVIL